MILEVMQLEKVNDNHMLYRESAYKAAYDKIPHDKYIPITKLIKDVYHDLAMVPKDKLKYDEKTKIVTLEIPDDIKQKVMGETLVPKVFINKSNTGEVTVQTRAKVEGNKVIQKVAEIIDFSFIEFSFTQEMSSFPGLAATVRNTPVILKEDGVEEIKNVEESKPEEIKDKEPLTDDEEHDDTINYSILNKCTIEKGELNQELCNSQTLELKKYLNFKKVGKSVLWADEGLDGFSSYPTPPVILIGELLKEDGNIYISFSSEKKTKVEISFSLLSAKTLPILYKDIKKSLKTYSGILITGAYRDEKGHINIRGLFYKDGTPEGVEIFYKNPEDK